jgi:hypothetical protein
MEELRKEINKIRQRNKGVELNKARETSTTNETNKSFLLFSKKTCYNKKLIK